MTCELYFETSDCDPTELFKSKIVKGRKEYECCECYEIIPKSKKHESASGLSNGEFWNYRTCNACCEIRDEYTRDGFIFGALWEAMNEDCREMPLDSLDTFSPEAQQKLLIMLD